MICILSVLCFSFNVNISWVVTMLSYMHPKKMLFFTLNFCVLHQITLELREILCWGQFYSIYQVKKHKKPKLRLLIKPLKILV